MPIAYCHPAAYCLLPMPVPMPISICLRRGARGSVHRGAGGASEGQAHGQRTVFVYIYICIYIYIFSFCICIWNIAIRSFIYLLVYYWYVTDGCCGCYYQSVPFCICGLILILWQALSCISGLRLETWGSVSYFEVSSFFSSSFPSFSSFLLFVFLLVVVIFSFF